MRAAGRSLLRGVRLLDRAVGRLGSPRRVLVDARTPMNLAVMRPVWRRLLDDTRVSVRFAAEREADVAEALALDGLRDALVSRRAARWQRIDLAMTADAWNDAPLNRCSRRINFFHGVAGKYDLDHPDRLKGAHLERFDRMAFINTDRLERYVRSGAIPRDRAVLVGFPKLDALLNGTWPAAAVRRDLGLAPAVETVLYAPTFSIASSLQAHGEAIVTALLDSGRNVIVKLHDRAMVPDPRHTGNVDWPARLTAAFASHPRFALARDADSGPCLSAADVLVTDHSTVGFEFALLDRPIVVFDAPDLKAAARIDDDKWRLLRSMADVAATPAALRDAVDRAFAHPGQRRDARRAAHDLFAHAGSATERALEVVYDLLGLAPLHAADRKSTVASLLSGHP